MLKIAESQFPLTMIFSEKDRLIPKEHFQSFAQFLGIEQISHDDSDATHRSNSNQSSQASFEQTADDVDIEINNNMPDLHRLSLNEKSKSMFDLHSETDSLSEHRDSEPDIKGELDQLNRLNRLDALHQLSDQDDDLDTAPADTVDSGESECQSERSDASSLSADNKKDVFSMISSEGQINFNGPKQAVCISKAGHYSLISHSHVIAQQIDKLLAAYDLRTANQTLGALPLKEWLTLTFLLFAFNSRS